MFTDNTLTPKEAVRLCALGILADGPKSYGDLATAVRHFVSHIIGPSLDVMGQSIELLKYEGLVEADGDERSSSDTVMEITGLGRSELHTLLTANIRHGATELNKLIVALKFRFMHILPPADQARQIDLLSDMCESELARLESLQLQHAGDDGLLGEWLEHDIELTTSRIDWLSRLRSRF